MIAILILIGLYCVVISLIIYGFYKLPIFKNEAKNQFVKFSVIIPFRNEAENLPQLFKSLSDLDYPKHLFEVLFINDASEDESVKICEAFISSSEINSTLLHSEKGSFSPKKEAITKAINKTKDEWIVTTDADCIFHKNWLKTYSNYIETNTTNLIAGPVAYHTKNTFFEAFQLLDFSSLIGVTIGTFGLKQPIMCNGANLAYTKTLFKKINGFEGNKTIASGDDVFLLEKAVALDKNKVHYLKNLDASVVTKPVKKLTELVSQRKRWASKTGKSNSLLTKLLGLLVLATNGVFIICLLNFAIPMFSKLTSCTYIIFKIIIDGVLIYKSLSFFKQTTFFKYYLLSAFTYPFFSVYIAILSLFGGYKWKNRTYKR